MLLEVSHDGPRSLSSRWVRPAALGGAALGLAAAVAALGRPGDDDAARLPSGLDLDDVGLVLLNEDDVGGTFRQTAPAGHDDVVPLSGSQGAQECGQVVELFDASINGDQRVLRVMFDDAHDARLFHVVGQIDKDEPSMAQARASLNQCGTMTWTDEEFQWEMRFSANELDGPGDEAFEVEIEIDVSRGTQNATSEGYAIIAMRRGVVSTVNLYGGVDPNTFESEPVDRDLVERLSERADQKIRQVVDLAPGG